jgi:hypothetical protein
MMAGVLASMSALGSEPMRVVEGEVIAAYLNTVEPDEAPKKALIIEQTTADVDEALTSGAGEQAREMLRKQLPQATEKVIDDFLRVLARPAALSIPSRLVRPNIRMQMVRVADIDRLFDTKSLGAAWENFYKAYPNAACLVRISRVGLDEEATQALVYLSVRSGGLRGSGHFVLLHRRFGIWRILASEQAWVS